MNHSWNYGKNVWNKIWTKKQRQGLWVATAKWNLLFCMNLSYKVYAMTNNLSNSLPLTKIPAIKTKKCAELMIDTFKSMRYDEVFDSFFEEVKKAAEPMKSVGKPTLTRKQKEPNCSNLQYVWLRRAWEWCLSPANSL